MVDPTQTDVGLPVMTDGVGLTVNNVVTMQPVGKVYLIVSTPTLNPVTTPEGLTVAIEEVLLDQEPPLVVSDKVLVDPMHVIVVPLIGFGSGITLIAVSR
jgi:hypothetical protein